MYGRRKTTQYRQCVGCDAFVFEDCDSHARLAAGWASLLDRLSKCDQHERHIAKLTTSEARSLRKADLEIDHGICQLLGVRRKRERARTSVSALRRPRK